jgi:hypothetical protein
MLFSLLGEPEIQPDAPFPALECCGGKALPGLSCQVSTNGVSLIPTLELKGNSIDGLHHPWICISKSWAFRHGGCQILVTAFQARHAAEAALPPIIGRGWVGEDQVSKKEWAKLGDGLVAPEKTGKGAINPW